LETVSAQTWQDIEHILVDGGSTDGTLSIIQAAAKRNPRLQWASAPDHGISDAMNKGLARATGDIVAFLHADDFYPECDVLKHVAEIFIMHPEIEWLTGGIQHVDSTDRLIRNLPVRRWSYSRLVRGNIIFHPATFVKRRVLEEVGGFDTKLRFAMDYDLWLRLSSRTAPYLSNRPLACFRIHSGSLSVSQVNNAFREEFAVRCRHLNGKPLQKILHCIYFWLKFLPNGLSVRGGGNPV
jgi:glycosyltransferase involved in cell wall biosynthesis